MRLGTQTATELATYAEIWNAVDTYGDESPGERVLPAFLQIVGDARGTVLDAGCGSGRGSLALERAGFDVTMCDLTSDGVLPEASHLPFVQACLWQPLPRRTLGRRYDYGYCTDVLEHVPTQFAILAVTRMLEAVRRGVFVSVCLVPDNYGIWVGKPLHQTVQSFEWWRDSLAEVGEVVDARDMLLSAVFYVVPRSL